MIEQGAYVVKIVLANQTGVPDLLACYKGRFLAIEVKDTGKKATKLQEYNIDKIHKSDGIAIVADSLDQVKKIINNINTGTYGSR